MIDFIEKAEITAVALPDCKFAGTGLPRSAQLLTQANFKAIADNLDITLRHNNMSGAVEISHRGVVLSAAGDTVRAVGAIADCVKRCDAGGGLGGMPAIMAEVAYENSFHPMAEWLRGLPEHDGEDHIGALAASVTTDSELWDTYLRRWLVQVVTGVTNTTQADQPLPYCLVLAGGQGVGKTQFFRSLNPEFVKSETELQLNSTSGKDHQIEALSYAIAELSEIDAVFRKSDSAALKAFLSRGVDSIRIPYAKAPVLQTRRTTFCASVNEVNFLNDPTGNRRFWPVLVSAIDWGYSLSIEKLWAQALALHASGYGFELTPDENAIKAEENHRFYSAPVEEDLLDTYFMRNGENWESYSGLTITEIVAVVGIRNPNKASVSSVKRWLNANLGVSSRMKGVRNCWAVPVSTWSAGLITLNGGSKLTAEEAKRLKAGRPKGLKLKAERRKG